MDINQIWGQIATNRRHFESITGVCSSDLSNDEILRLRPLVYEYIAAHSDDTIFMKIHDSYIYNDENIPIIPSGVTTKVLYLIRNPLDVAVSYAFHLDKSFNEIINDIAF